MLSVYRTLSVRYLSRRWFRALLIVASIALGVATLVATQALNETMTRASLARINPMPGVADLVVTNSQGGVDSDLAKALLAVDGVEQAWPRIFDNVRIPELANRSVLVIGIDFHGESEGQSLNNITLTPDKDLLDLLKDAEKQLDGELKNNKQFAPMLDSLVQWLQQNKFLDDKMSQLVADYLKRRELGQSTDAATLDLVQRFIPPALVGEELLKELEQVASKETGLEAIYRDLKLEDDFLGSMTKKVIASFPDWLTGGAVKVLAHRFDVQKTAKGQKHSLLRFGKVSGTGDFAVLRGNVLVLDIADAARILEMEPGKVNRIDIILKPGADKDKVQQGLREVAAGHGQVLTPEEHVEAMGSALNGMRTGFSLCGIAALVVGLFLVYNALSVSVAERRHEIGVLLSLGATRRQVRQLFAGEAAFLGILGSLVGIPLGVGLAYLGLQPAKEILGDIFVKIEADKVNLSWWLISLATTCGVLTSLVAGLVPAVAASKENPAAAVHRVSKAPTWSNLAWHITASLALMGGGLLAILLRDQLRRLQEHLSTLTGQTNRLGTYGGMILFLLGALLAAPLLAAVIARAIQPLARRFFSITWRLAADNLVMAPGGTGLVIAALAAGVALVTQTYGTIVSNKKALGDWVQDTFAADLIVSGSPVSAGGSQAEEMTEADGAALRNVKNVEAVLPMGSHKIIYKGGEALVFSFEAGNSYELEKRRPADQRSLELYKTLSENPNNTVIVSENFRALHGVGKGDSVALDTDQGVVKFLVIGTMLDYSFNRGTIFIDRARYKQLWKNFKDKVEMFDVFVKRGDLTDELFAVRVKEVQKSLRELNTGKAGLWVQTRQEFHERILDMIDRLYALALSQQFVVMFVAALGVVTALLIAVLQRRREMGLLRAIGALQSQVVRSVLAEACLMGIIGTIIGIGVGIPLQWYVLRVVILEESGFLFPMYLPWKEGLFIAVAAMTTATLAGLGPALHSVRMRIPEAIAYE